MNIESAEEIFSKKTILYRVFFFGLLRYGAGMRKLFKSLDLIRPDMKVLDAGCGTGILTQILYEEVKFEVRRPKADKEVQFHAFDITQKMLDVFQEWIIKEDAENIKIQKADATKLDKELPKDWTDYDLIVSSAMLEYISKDKILNVFSDLLSRLKPDGKMVFVITKKNRLMNLLIKRWWKANMYEKEELKSILKNSGFKSIEFRKFPFPYFYLSHWGFVVEVAK